MGQVCRIVLAGVVVVSSFVVAGCRTRQAVADLNDLVDRLRGAGATVEISARTASNLHLSVTGRVVVVNGEDVGVFEYQDIARARTEATALTGVGPGLVFFEEGQPPVLETLSGRMRYYRSGRLILVHEGESEAVLGPLEEVVGRPLEIR